MFKNTLWMLIASFVWAGSLHAQTVLVSRPAITPVDNDNGELSGESDRFGNFRGLYPVDHFTLTATTTLDHIDVFGTTQTGSSNSFLYTGFTLHIFADDMGQPDGLAYDSSGGSGFGSDGVVYLPNVSVGSGLSYLQDSGICNIRIDFATANGGVPITLPAGEYWVSVGPRMPDTPVGDPSGRWNWQTSNAQPDSAPLVMDSDIGIWDSFFNLSGSSFAWELAGEVEAVEVGPNSATVVSGTYVSGTSSDMGNSDDSDFSARRNRQKVQSRVFIELKTVSPNAMPNELDFTLEASVFARTSVTQSIDLYNYTSNSWEQIDSRDASRFTDESTTVSVGGDLARYVEPGTNCMEARIRFQSARQRQAFSAGLDQAIWTIQ